jgi:hypothetical protein
MYISDYNLHAFLISPTRAACLAHLILFDLVTRVVVGGCSQWSRALRYRSAATRLLKLWVRNAPEAWMFVCCVFSGRGLCDELITPPEESYQLWCVIVCGLETSKTRRPWPELSRSATEKKISVFNAN